MRMIKLDKHADKVLVALFILLMALVAFYLLSRQEVARLHDPSGQYTAVVTERRYQNFLMSNPGGGRDSAVFVEIFHQKGESFGRIPVEIGWMVDELKWTPSGAELMLVGEWDFQRRTCSYRSEDGSREIWVRR